MTVDDPTQAGTQFAASFRFAAGGFSQAIGQSILAYAVQNFPALAWNQFMISGAVFDSDTDIHNLVVTINYNGPGSPVSPSAFARALADVLTKAFNGTDSVDVTSVSLSQMSIQQATAAGVLPGQGTTSMPQQSTFDVIFNAAKGTAETIASVPGELASAASGAVDTLASSDKTLEWVKSNWPILALAAGGLYVLTK